MDDAMTMTLPSYPRVIEMIKGQIYKMARPAISHVRASRSIFRILDNHFQGKKCEFFPEPQVQLGDDEVAPDACVVCDPSKVTKTKIVGAPDLVIEILSPSTRRKDMEAKHPLYEEHGVKEYWMIEPVSGDVTIYSLLENGKYNNPPRTYPLLSEEDKTNMARDGLHYLIIEEFTSPLFPELTIKLSELFEYLEQ